MGGLSKKLFQIKTITENRQDNRLLLDSGNLLFKRKTVAQDENQERLTAATILDIYTAIGYDAVAVGSQDLAGGLALLQESKKKGFPWLSANITDANGQLLFNNFIKKEIKGQKIFITAVTNTSEPSIPGVHIQSWEEVLAPLLKQIVIDDPNSFIILLSTLNNSENKLIIQKFPEISLLIAADVRQGNVSPALHESTLLTQTAKQGKYQGLLEISFGNNRTWGKDSLKKLADLQNKLGSLNWQLRRLQKKSTQSETPEKYSTTIQRLEKEKEELAINIRNMDKQVAKEQMEGAANDQFTYRFLALKKNMPNDQPTEDRLRKLNRDIRALNSQKKETKKNNPQATIVQIPQLLIGSPTCATCHELQDDFWKTTKHATAYDTLVKKRKSLDLECLPCHMTIDVPGGKFESLLVDSLLSYPEELQSVGCETCHGNGRKHLQDPEHFKLVRTPGINICLTCHTEEHDDDFQYWPKLKKIACPAS